MDDEMPDAEDIKETLLSYHPAQRTRDGLGNSAYVSSQTRVFQTSIGPVCLSCKLLLGMRRFSQLEGGAMLSL